LPIRWGAFTDNLLLRQTGCLAKHAVYRDKPENIAGLDSENENNITDTVENERQLSFIIQNYFFHALALGNIDRHGTAGGNIPLLIQDRRDREADMADFPILANHVQFFILDDLPGLEELEQPPSLLLTQRGIRINVEDRAANYILHLITQHPRDLLISHEYPAVRIHGIIRHRGFVI
jgi:hypothetical protein